MCVEWCPMVWVDAAAMFEYRLALELVQYDVGEELNWIELYKLAEMERDNMLLKYFTYYILH